MEYTARRTGISQQCQCFYIASEFNARVVFLMFCFSEVCFFTYISFRAVLSVFSLSVQSTQFCSLLFLLYYISVLINEIFIHSFNVWRRSPDEDLLSNFTRSRRVSFDTFRMRVSSARRDCISFSLTSRTRCQHWTKSVQLHYTSMRQKKGTNFLLYASF